MELETEDLPGWDRSPVAFTKTGGVSQFGKIATILIKQRGLYSGGDL